VIKIDWYKCSGMNLIMQMESNIDESSIVLS
jgi:hypothetical protein